MNDGVASRWAVAAVGLVVGILFYVAIVVGNTQGTVVGIVIAGALGTAIALGIDYYTE